MVFQGSKLELDLNAFWNEHIIELDKQIRTIQLFPRLTFFEDGDVGGLVERYMKSARFLIKKIDSALSVYADTDYIRNYKEQTINEIVEDLDLYSDVAELPYHQGYTNQFLTMNQISPPKGYFNIIY